MKAIGVYQARPSNDPDCFSEFEVEIPPPQGRELLIRVKAIAVNPIDYKVRASLQQPQAVPRILGWDAAGIVEAVGPAASLFQAGDSVFYAGSMTRPGCNAEYQLVDERIVGHHPSNLTFEQAAALPLTSITAWESLFERLCLEPTKSPQQRARTLLIINGAGGVGSIAIQLAKQVAGVQVIATASRPETLAWCKRLGADECLNHHQPLLDQFKKLRLPLVDYILCAHSTDHYWQPMADCIKPQGHICSIVGNKNPLNLDLLKNKSASFAWEFMFTKSMYETDDMQSQHDLLNRIADLVEGAALRTTLSEHLGPLNRTNLSRAHAKLEAGNTLGKLVLSGL